LPISVAVPGYGDDLLEAETGEVQIAKPPHVIAAKQTFFTRNLMR
jgi:hypothetical protein